jgi:hypothetical protein
LKRRKARRKEISSHGLTHDRISEMKEKKEKEE